MTRDISRFFHMTNPHWGLQIYIYLDWIRQQAAQDDEIKKMYECSVSQHDDINKNVCVYCVHIYRRKRCYITLLACV